LPFFFTIGAWCFQACDLSELVKTNDFPHLLFYGPSGAGKRTRIHCILRELYGVGAERLRLDKKLLVTPSNRKIEIDTVSSNYHIEMNPAEVGIYDRFVVQEVIKQMAETAQIASSTQKNFKVVVLMEADYLTRDAQHGLRRTMEKYSMSCRLILCCESLSRIIDPLKSRCMAVRVAAPSDDEVREVCLTVADKVRLTVPDSVMAQIITKARGNLRRALLSMEAVKRKGQPIKDNEQVPEPEWEIYLRETADLMLKKQNNEAVLAVRERLYELISRCIQPNVIFSYLLRELLKRCPQSAQLETVQVAALYEHRLRRGQKPIIHLEAFVVAFMDIYLNNLNSNLMET
uniref:AAA domain-containing protein n=1 Tax=Angiostrongylus costaricensis TaxID=334426 RepID=A0A158PKA5_ANGCS